MLLRLALCLTVLGVVAYGASLQKQKKNDIKLERLVRLLAKELTHSDKKILHNDQNQRKQQSGVGQAKLTKMFRSKQFRSLLDGMKIEQERSESGAESSGSGSGSGSASGDEDFKYRCSDGTNSTFVDLYEVCDGENDCPSGEDEASCSYQCTNGTEIGMDELCDGNQDCPSGEDEIGCGFCCVDDWTDCTEEISWDAWCDINEDCSNGHDEDQCSLFGIYKKNMEEKSLDSANELIRLLKDLIAKTEGSKVQEHSLSKRRTGSSRIAKLLKLYKLPNNKAGIQKLLQILKSKKRRTVRVDKSLTSQFSSIMKRNNNAMDEIYKLYCAQDNVKMCANGKLDECYPKEWHCDCTQDCSDGSDEDNCPGLACGDMLSCDNGETFYDEESKCDCYFDCDDGADEDNCDVECAGSFDCDDGVEEIPAFYQCDGIVDCDDGSDEKADVCGHICDGDHMTNCSEDTDGTSCYDDSLDCDRFFQCPNDPLEDVEATCSYFADATVTRIMVRKAMKLAQKTQH